MRTFKRICIKNYDEVVVTTTDDGKQEEVTIRLYRGVEYITSPTKIEVGIETVTVFESPYWISHVPVDIFAGAKVFTEA